MSSSGLLLNKEARAEGGLGADKSIAAEEEAEDCSEPKIESKRDVEEEASSVGRRRALSFVASFFFFFEDLCFGRFSGLCIEDIPALSRRPSFSTLSDFRFRFLWLPTMTKKWQRFLK